MSIFDKTIDKQGPVKCCRSDCKDPERESDRYGIVVMLYSMDPTVHTPIQLHLSLQVCKDCQDKIVPTELISESHAVMFRVAISKSNLPEYHPARVLNPERTKIAWRVVGKYEKARFVDVGASGSTPSVTH